MSALRAALEDLRKRRDLLDDAIAGIIAVMKALGEDVSADGNGGEQRRAVPLLLGRAPGDLAAPRRHHRVQAKDQVCGVDGCSFTSTPAGVGSHKFIVHGVKGTARHHNSKPPMMGHVPKDWVPVKNDRLWCSACELEF